MGALCPTGWRRGALGSDEVTHILSVKQSVSLLCCLTVTLASTLWKRQVACPHFLPWKRETEGHLQQGRRNPRKSLSCSTKGPKHPTPQQQAVHPGQDSVVNIAAFMLRGEKKSLPVKIIAQWPLSCENTIGQPCPKGRGWVWDHAVAWVIDGHGSEGAAPGRR